MAIGEVSTEWSRRHLLIVLGVVVAVVLLLIAGLAYVVLAAVGTNSSTASAGPKSTDQKAWPVGADGVRGDAYRDAVAAEPMLKTNDDDMRPAAPALDEPERMVIAPATKRGPAEVPSGFDHTPEGAVAQLAAIEVAALTPMSVGYARDVHHAWAMDGASFDRWGIAEAIQSFHTSAGTVDGDGGVSLTAKPVGAQIKGTDGPDWVMACVQLDVTVVVVEQVRFGYGYCERMQWGAGRWMIAPGAPAAQAPSTWPASQRSLDAGWRLWVDQEAN